MKKLSLGLLVFVALLVSCGGGKKVETTAVVEEVVSEVVTPEANAKNSLDYNGAYTGVLPTANGDGMNITVVLGPENSFTKTFSYVGKKDKPVTTTGKYVWSADGNTITLESVDAPNQYFVSEGQIIQLDTEGKPITGDLAKMQILKKVAE